MARDFPVIVEGPTILGIAAFRDRDWLLRAEAPTEPMEQESVERELRRRIKEAFAREGFKMGWQDQNREEHSRSGKDAGSRTESGVEP